MLSEHLEVCNQGQTQARPTETIEQAITHDPNAADFAFIEEDKLAPASEKQAK